MKDEDIIKGTALQKKRDQLKHLQARIENRGLYVSSDELRTAFEMLPEETQKHIIKAIADGVGVELNIVEKEFEAL